VTARHRPARMMNDIQASRKMANGTIRRPKTNDTGKGAVISISVFYFQFY